MFGFLKIIRFFKKRAFEKKARIIGILRAANGEMSTRAIRDAYRDCSGCRIALATIHSILHEFQSTAIVCRRYGPPTPDRGGNRIIYYRYNRDKTNDIELKS